MKIKCITIDDEHLAHKLLADYIKKVPMLELVGQFKKAADALEIINTGQVDLIFLDIQMPDFTGIEFMESLQNKPLVIFTTAYSEYALKGYELEVIDYLLKPIEFERFIKAVNKAAKQFMLQSNNSENTPEKTGTGKEQDFIFVKSGYKSIKVKLDDILYIEGLKEYANIFTEERKYTMLERLKNLESTLPSHKFMRVHKSFIVAIDKIDAIYGNIIEIKNKKIPVGRTYKKEIENTLLKNKK